MSTSLISIIIPTFNRSHLIGETLDSIVKQTYTNWECIIVDDGSTDETDKFLDSYIKNDSRFKYYKRPDDRPKGANACRNYGFELSKGNYINWFDDDDIMHSHKLELQIKQLKKEKKEFSVCQTIVFENSINNIIGLRHKQIVSKNSFEDFLKKKIVWLTQAPLWRKSFLNSLPYLFDESLQAAQEWEFHTRVLFINSDYSIVDEPLVYLRQHKKSISYDKNRLLIRNENYVEARIKIFFMLNGQEEYKEESLYLLNFIINYYKKFLIEGDFNSARKVLNSFILKVKNIPIKKHLALIMVYYTYTIFGKGYCLLNKMEFDNE